MSLRSDIFPLFSFLLHSFQSRGVLSISISVSVSISVLSWDSSSIRPNSSSLTSTPPCPSLTPYLPSCLPSTFRLFLSHHHYFGVFMTWTSSVSFMCPSTLSEVNWMMAPAHKHPYSPIIIILLLLLLFHHSFFYFTPRLPTRPRPRWAEQKVAVVSAPLGLDGSGARVRWRLRELFPLGGFGLCGRAAMLEKCQCIAKEFSILWSKSSLRVAAVT